MVWAGPDIVQPNVITAASTGIQQQKKPVGSTQEVSGVRQIE